MDHDGPVNGSQSSDMESNQKATLSAVEMQDQMDQFTHIMHQKFLSGEDRDYLDYSKIDDDETLDDHWLREANYDAEDKYFAEDEWRIMVASINQSLHAPFSQRVSYTLL